jgi:hypothetical protein
MCFSQDRILDWLCLERTEKLLNSEKFVTDSERVETFFLVIFGVIYGCSIAVLASRSIPAHITTSLFGKLQIRQQLVLSVSS